MGKDKAKQLAASNAWRERNRDHVNTRARLNRAQKKHGEVLKILVMCEYGGPQCNRCGFGDIRALQMDHIEGNGAEHRRQIGTLSIYKWLKREGFPPGFQVLCANCNWIKRHECGEFSSRKER